MFDPDREDDVVRKLKVSLNIPDEPGEAPKPDPPESPARQKRRCARLTRRHGVGYEVKERLMRSVDQAKLLARLSMEAKRAPKAVKKPKPKPPPSDETRLELIFKHIRKLRAQERQP